MGGYPSLFSGILRICLNDQGELKMNLITWLIVGSISGLLVGLILRTNEQLNPRINIFVGIVGAIAAGIFITPMFDIETINQRTFSLPSMLVSLGGAIILLMTLHLFLYFRRVASAV
jgi:uncharacterized membrane protein YeaQ/YmgE (transglycosylase-associated protein family)